MPAAAIGGDADLVLGVRGIDHVVSGGKFLRLPTRGTREQSHRQEPPPCATTASGTSTAARVGDRLVSTVFPTAVTRGFCEPGIPHVAVCLLPGTELSFDRDVEYDMALGFTPTRKLPERTAVFRRLEPDRPYQHHDALEFPSGRIVLLTRLLPGRHATVLQLPVSAMPVP